MDDADRAQDRIEAELQARIDAARGIVKGGRSLTPRDSANECEECGSLIPSARQIAIPGCTLCVDCAARLEREARHYAR